MAFVEQLAADSLELPIIFGSSDRNETAFQEYFGTMPWHAFPLGDTRIEVLKRKYEVSGIPWLVILDKNGNLVANEADTDVPKGVGAYRKWLSDAKATRSVSGAA